MKPKYSITNDITRKLFLSGIQAFDIILSAHLDSIAGNQALQCKQFCKNCNTADQSQIATHTLTNKPSHLTTSRFVEYDVKN